MCGITGIMYFSRDRSVNGAVLKDMNSALHHRGPDHTACFIGSNVGFGFQRLSIIDLENGMQPFFSEDRQVWMICNGEIYNYRSLKEELIRKGYVFRTSCDVEVIIPLYLEYGIRFMEKLNGQFAIAISDGRDGSMLLVRDHFGICPLFYTVTDGALLFASEIKAIIRYPGFRREVDMTGLDQVFSFPGIVSPSTMFKNVSSLKPGHYLLAHDGKITEKEYWDLLYPEEGHEYSSRSEESYAEELEALLISSVRQRLNADVPVGFYLSGGLDSSLIGALMKHVNPGVTYNSFGIGFPDEMNREIDERRYQRLVATAIGSRHNELHFDWKEISSRLRDAVYYSECALKESYNTCSLALSSSVRDSGIKVILSGEGADEIFGGYVGYRFDAQRPGTDMSYDLETMLEMQERKKLWDDDQFFYEKDYYDFFEVKKLVYSVHVCESFNLFNSHHRLELDKSKLKGRNVFNKRSYVDFKLRLCDHLIADHCDRTCYANSIEGRYPFLDVNLIEFVKQIPHYLKLNGPIEKYILKRIGHKYLPFEISKRQKQGFVAPGSPYLLNKNIDWILDILSYDRIKRQGYFNPDTVENMKKMYSQHDFKLNLPFDSDILMIILTFNIFLDVFEMPDYAV